MKRDRLHDSIGNFTIIPNEIIKKTAKMGSHTLTLFVYLRYRTNQKTQVAFPSIRLRKSSTGFR